jgi:hypothetical protein
MNLGGCFCGSVRYRVGGKPVLSLICFCRDCVATSGSDGYTELGLVSIATGSLDEPDVFKPTKAVFVADALSWARIPEGLERAG